MQREENMQRSRSSVEIKQLAARIPIIDVLQSRDKFTLRPFPFPQHICVDPRPGRWDSDNCAFSESYKGKKPIKMGEIGVVSEKEFELAFLEIFAEGQSSTWTGPNVMAAGGAVMACLAPPPNNFRASPIDSDESKNLLRKWFHKHQYETSDIDLFIFGVSSEEEFRKKVVQIYQQVAMADCGENTECGVVKTKNSFTIVRGYPYRCIQIMRAMYNTKADVLSHFDLDCVAVGYDGKSVVCLPRFRRAFRSKTNVFNGQLSLISCTRAEKYNLRGFAFALPRFTTINSSTGNPRMHQLHMLLGLGKMNLLHSNHIKFNTDTNLRDWFLKEWPWGYTVPCVKPCRAIQRWKFPTLNEGGLWPTTMESEGSCGMYGFRYYRGMTLRDIMGSPRGRDIKCAEEVFDLKKVLNDSSVDGVAKGPSWFGAPPTSDWEMAGNTVGDTNKDGDRGLRQLVPLRYDVSVFEVVVDVKDGSELMERDASKKVDVIDSAGRAWIVHLKCGVKSFFAKRSSGWHEVLTIGLEYVHPAGNVVEETATMNSKRQRTSNPTHQEDASEPRSPTFAEEERVLCCANVLIGCTPSSWTLLRDIDNEDEKEQRSKQVLWLDLSAIFTTRNKVSGKAKMWLKHFRQPSLLQHNDKARSASNTPVMASDEVRLAFTIQTLNYKPSC